MRKTLKIIVAVWSIFITLDEVARFFSGTISFATFPYVAVILFAVGVLILLPGMDKFDRFLMVIALALFGYHAVVGIIAFVQNFGGTAVEDILVYLTTQIKTIVFYLIPAALSLMYLTNKK